MKTNWKGSRKALLVGPPREMFRDGINEERWKEIKDRNVWLRLAKLRQAGAELNTAARERLNRLSESYPNWRLFENERDEFPTWMGDGSELRTHMPTPFELNELIEWLRKNPKPDDWQTDEWRDRCRDNFDNVVSALTALAAEGIWPTGRWREALQCWSGAELNERSWHEMAPVLAGMPKAELQKLPRGVSLWLEKLARIFEGQEEVFFLLCERVLDLDYDIEDVDDDFVGRAINHPVGLVTQALLHWWYRQNLGDGQGLADNLKRWFTWLCDTEIQSFRHGRLLLAAHVISLFQVDREWTRQFILPLFEWRNSEMEACSAWEGFLWSPRLYDPLMEELKPTFLGYGESLQPA